MAHIRSNELLRWKGGEHRKTGKKNDRSIDKGRKGLRQNQPRFGVSKFKIGATAYGSRIVLWGK